MEPILDRVRKLLALATSPNVHEAATAAARAHALIEQHRLQALLDSDPDPDPVTDGADAPLENARKLRKWRVALAIELAELHGCAAYTAATPDGDEIRVVGRAADREAIRAMWGWLVDRIQWLSATEGAGKPRRWHDAFRIGAIDAVIERMIQARAEVRGALPAQALVRLDPALADRARAVASFVERELRLAPGRAFRVDARAFERGRDAGGRMPLSPARRR